MSRYVTTLNHSEREEVLVRRYIIEDPRNGQTTSKIRQRRVVIRITTISFQVNNSSIVRIFCTKMVPFRY